MLIENPLKENSQALSVSEFSEDLRKTLENKYSFVKLKGEISGYRGPHTSGHAYFSLKDNQAVIDAVIWRSNFSKLSFALKDGMEVIVYGKVAAYTNRSKYQIVIETVEEAGLGSLMAQLEKTRLKLEAEGLFQKSRKQNLSFLPKVIGIITSPTGAVIQDMVHRLKDRFLPHVLLWPVSVQGKTCASDVSSAIEGFNSIKKDDVIPRPDVIIVARGGGSLEDLWEFNNEMLVRAVAASKIPIISAIGHETDVTLIDYAADVRAPTPSAAAEMVVPVKADLIQKVQKLDQRQRSIFENYIFIKTQRIDDLSRIFPYFAKYFQQKKESFLQLKDKYLISYRNFLEENSRKLNLLYIDLEKKYTHIFWSKANFYQKISAPFEIRLLYRRIEKYQQIIDGLEKQYQQNYRYNLSKTKAHYQLNAQLLDSLSYQRSLERGFALVLDQNGAVVKTAEKMNEHEIFTLKFFDGQKNIFTTNDEIKK